MKPREASAEGGERSSVEVRARTVDEAVARGLVRLGGLSRAEVEIEVLSEGRAGVLGFGAEDAVVRLTVGAPPQQDVERPAKESRRAGGEPPAARQPAEPAARQPVERAARQPVEPVARQPAEPVAAAAAMPAADTSFPASEADTGGGPPSEEAVRIAIDLTRGYLEHLGYEDVAVEPGASLLPIEVENEAALVLNIRGTGVRRLLVEDGRPLLALQFLIRLALNREAGTWVNLLLDVDGDRARRVTELFDMAAQSAELVDREGRPVALPPMSPYERRVVHLALRDHPVVTTQSIGRGETRKVTVRLKGQLLTGV